MQLRIRQPNGQQRLVPLRPQQTLRLGSDPTVDIVLAGAGVQPSHCGVMFRDGQFRVIASKSAGRLEVNGSLVSSAPLEEGDQFRLGDVLVAIVSDTVSLKAPIAQHSAAPAKPPAKINDDQQIELVTDEALETTHTSPLPADDDDELQLAPPDEDTAVAHPPTAPGKVTRPASIAGPTPAPIAGPVDDLPLLDDDPADAALDTLQTDANAPSSVPADVDVIELIDDEVEKKLKQITKGTADREMLGDEPLALEDAGGMDGGGPLSGRDGLLGGFLSSTPMTGGQGAAGLGSTLKASGTETGGAREDGPSVATPAMAAPVEPKRSSRLGSIVKIIGALLFIGPAVGIVVLLIARQPTAAERFQQADELFQSGTVLATINAFDAFIDTYPSDARSDEARVKRVLAEGRPQATAGGDRTAAFAALDQAARRLGPLSRHPVAEQAWADWGPKIAAALFDRAKAAVAQADAARAESAVAQAELALAWVRNHVPPDAQSAQGVDDLEVQLAALSRSQKQAQALETARESIHRSIQENQPAGAYVAAERLLADYPALAGNVALQEAMALSTAVELNRVQTTADGPAPLLELPDELVSLRGVCSRVSSPPESGGAVGVVAVLDQVHGSVFALDAATGRVLWRRFVGYDSASPQALPGEPPGLLILDSAHEEFQRVEAITGHLIWRQPLSGPAFAPAIMSEMAFVATRAGILLQLDAGSGAILARYEFPLPLGAPPVADAATQRVFQLADQAQLFVVSVAERRCAAAAYTGHVVGGVVVPPLVVGSQLVLIERDGLRDTRLQLFDMTGIPRRSDLLLLRGSVLSPPVAADDTLYLATDDGTVQSISVTAGERNRGFRRGPTWNPLPGDRPPLTQLTVSAGRLWGAGMGLSSWPLPWRDGTPPFVEMLPPDEHVVQPLETAADSNIVVKRRGSGLTIVALPSSPSTTSPKWETSLGELPAAGPIADAVGTSAWLLQPCGDLFRITVNTMADADAQLEPVVSLQSGDSAQRGYLTAVGKHVAAGFRGEHAITLLSADLMTETRTVPLSGPLAGMALAGDGVLWVALQTGEVVIIDVETAAPRGEPLIPPWNPNQPLDVQGPVPVGQGGLAIGMQGRLLVTAADELPTVRPVVKHEVTMSSPLRFGPAAADGMIWGVDVDRRAVAWSTDDLALVGEFALGADVAWGPTQIGNLVLLATTDGRLRRLGDRPTPLWETSAIRGIVAGATPIDAQRLLIAMRNGDLVLLASDTGQPLAAPLKTNQPLAGNPLVLGDRVIVATADGCLLQLNQALSSFTGGATLSIDSPTPE